MPVLIRLLSPAYCQLPPARCLDRDRVILLTDGQANHGIVDPAVLVEHAAELTEEGIATTTLCYGEDFNEDLLTALADFGRGNAYHVETACIQGRGSGFP